VFASTVLKLFCISYYFGNVRTMLLHKRGDFYLKTELSGFMLAHV
jgi:hypothetical protein